MKFSQGSKVRVLTAALLLAGIGLAPGQITYTRLGNKGSLKLHQMRPNGTGDTTLNFPYSKVGFPTWSKDGSQLAVTAFQPSKIPTHSWNVFSVVDGGRTIRKLTNFTDILDPDNKSFSYTFP